MNNNSEQQEVVKHAMETCKKLRKILDSDPTQVPIPSVGLCTNLLVIHGSDYLLDDLPSKYYMDIVNEITGSNYPIEGNAESYAFDSKCNCLWIGDSLTKRKDLLNKIESYLAMIF